MASQEPDAVHNEVTGSSTHNLSQIGQLHGDLNIYHGADSPRMNRLRETADDLANTISGLESKALTQLLGEAGAPRPANITFDRLALIQWRANGSGQQGDLNQISDYYRALKSGRLVVVGDPGSGKTVLAVHLVRELLRTRPSTRCPVPVRVSLSSFNPFPGGEGLDEVSDETLASRFDAWLAAQLVDRGVQRRRAPELVRNKLILPVLDGLDEMDASTEPPDHAAAVVRILNDGGRPFVLTSRRDRHEQLLRHNSIEPTLPQDATTVVLQPLNPAVVRDYLTYLFPDPTHPSGIVEHWRATVDALSDERPDPLVAALCSPWQLYLCRTAFANSDHGDPHKQLAGLAPDELTNELMCRLIPAAVDHHRRPEGTRYTADQVTTWMTTFARHLRDTSKRGGSGTDILLHELWWVAGPRLPRYLSTIMLTLLVALLTFVGLDIGQGSKPLSTWDQWLILSLVGITVVYTGYRATRKSARPTRFDLRSLATRRGRRALLSWLVIGSVVGLAVGFALAPLRLLFPAEVGFAFAPEIAHVLGPVIGLTAGLVVGLDQMPSLISAPHELVRQGLIRDSWVAFAAWLAVAVVYSLESEVVTGLVVGLAYGLIVGFVGLRPSPWPRYLVAVLLLRYRHGLPLRAALFLDWAYAAGLVRLSGIAIQFRHDTFRAWLTQQDVRLADPAEPHRNQPPDR